MSATAAQNAIAVVGIDIRKNSFHIVVCGLLDRDRLTQDAIDQASRAVIDWANALSSKTT